MKTENYLGMIAHIAPPPPKTTPPPSINEGGVQFHCRDVPWRVSTDGLWNYSMLRYSSTIPPEPYTGQAMISLAWNWHLPELVCGNSLRIGNNRKDNVHKNNKGQTRTRRFAPSFQFSVLSSSVFYTTY